MKYVFRQFNKMLSMRFILQCIPLLIVDICYLIVRFAVQWNTSFSALIYLLSSPSGNTVPISAFSYYISKQIWFFLITFLCYFICCLIVTILQDKYHFKFAKIRFVTLTAYVLILCFMWHDLCSVGFCEYISNLYIDSSYIEDNYISSDSINITFPNQKRNLIILNLESMEQSYADSDNNGLLDENLIPQLTKLSNENVSISSIDTNAMTQMYADYTFASLVAVSAGIPFKGSLDANVVALSGNETNTNILLSLDTIGTILGSNGYTNVAIMGSKSEFSGKDSFLRNHGNYQIYDYKRAKEDGVISSDYCVRWGMEDAKVFGWAKDILTNLGQSSEPFNVMIETSDIHFPDGYVCEYCHRQHSTTLPDVINCTDRQVYEFVKWAQTQDWYDNTTIVLLGDHLYMGTDCFENYGIYGKNNRTIYNCFVNLPDNIDISYVEDRAYTTMDMFPTILSSIGIHVSGERLGLGTNLFSDVPTLVERDGYDTVYKELGKHSDFYDKL